MSEPKPAYYTQCPARYFSYGENRHCTLDYPHDGLHFHPDGGWNGTALEWDEMGKPEEPRPTVAYSEEPVLRDEPATWEEALDFYWRTVARPLMVNRHRKYGPNNILAHGELGLLVRADDKRARIMNNSGDHEDESTADAWLDWSNYVGPIRWMLANGYWSLPMEGS